jgi:hypothetical protein
MIFAHRFGNRVFGGGYAGGWLTPAHRLFAELENGREPRFGIVGIVIA